MPSEQIVRNIMARTSYFSWDDDDTFLIDQQDSFFIVLIHR